MHQQHIQKLVYFLPFRKLSTTIIKTILLTDLCRTLHYNFLEYEPRAYFDFFRASLRTLECVRIFCLTLFLYVLLFVYKIRIILLLFNVSGMEGSIDQSSCLGRSVAELPFRRRNLCQDFEDEEQHIRVYLRLKPDSVSKTKKVWSYF